MYATVSDMITRFGATEITQLSDPEHTGDMDEAIVVEALTDASDTIDSYVRAKYSLPLPETPRILRTHACDIARYKLHVGAVPERVEKAYDHAIAWLKDLASGKVKLGIVGEDGEASGEAPTSAGSISFQCGGRIFSRDRMNGY